jgi:hypothetical protein
MFVPNVNAAGIQPIGASSPTPNQSLGRIIGGDDPVYGSGEFIYLLGVASTVVGSLVTWGGVSGANVPTYQTALAPSTANLAQPLAVAMSANGAGQYGWYQIGGTAVALTGGTFAAAGPAYIGVAAGTVTSVAAAGKQVVNAAGLTAVGVPAANQVLLSLNRPFAQGAIT